MTIRDALAEGYSILEGHETQTPRLDASLLLSHSRGISREKLYMELGEPCTEHVLESYRTALERRLSGEPVAWIIGFKEFWGMRFRVGPGVLCPRPDSEILVEAALETMDYIESVRNGPRLHDCCCGPGTLGIALGAERPNWEVSASDISPDAAKYFKINNQNLAGGRLTYHHSDLMEGIPGPFDIIVSNPPYLTPDGNPGAHRFGLEGTGPGPGWRRHRRSGYHTPAHSEDIQPFNPRRNRLIGGRPLADAEYSANTSLE
jgi:release factor glutamine methyltransferase